MMRTVSWWCRGVLYRIGSLEMMAVFLKFWESVLYRIGSLEIIRIIQESA